MPFYVKDISNNKYMIVYDINFYAMGSVNPDVKFLMWDIKDECWRVDYAANYILVSHEEVADKYFEEEK